jgi:hypothetical protein
MRENRAFLDLVIHPSNLLYQFRPDTYSTSESDSNGTTHILESDTAALVYIHITNYPFLFENLFNFRGETSL